MKRVLVFDGAASAAAILHAASLTLGGLAYIPTYGANDSAGAGYRTVALKVANA